MTVTVATTPRSVAPSVVVDAASSASACLPPAESAYASLVRQYLALPCLDNATFFAERMVARCPDSEHARHLLATCHHRAGEPRRARAVLRARGRPRLPASRYLLARCCADQGAWREAEECLRPTPYRGRDDDDDHDHDHDHDVPCGAAGLHLLGVVCRRSHRTRQAVRWFRKSLAADPMMWVSFEALCEMGADVDDGVDPTEIFGTAPPTRREEPPARNDDDADARGSVVDAATRDDAGCSSRGATRRPATQQQNRVLFASPLDDNNHNNDNDDEVMETTPPSQGIPALDLSFNTPMHPSVRRYSARKDRGDDDDDHDVDIPEAASRLFRDDDVDVHRDDGGNDHTFNLHDVSAISRGSATEPRRRRGRRSDASFVRDDHDDDRASARFRTPDVSFATAAASVVVDRRDARPSLAHADRAAVADAHGGRGRASDADGSALTRARRVVGRLYYEPSPTETTTTTTPRDRSFLGTDHDLSRLSYSDDDDPSFSDRAAERRSLFRSGGVRGTTTPTPTTTPTTTTPANVSGGARRDRDKESSARRSQTTTDKGRQNVTAAPTEEPAEDCVREILSLLCTLGAAYQMLCLYKCRSALRLFHTLTPAQFDTGWVQHQIGRAHFELADYSAARRALERMRAVDPVRVRGLELLSTALWHLRREVDLCRLAQEAVDLDRDAPQSWCVVGNCFSLQKEHETALRFLRRAAQLDPDFAYAHTLSGHEYASNEDFDRAATCYRDAVRADARHYNAWYGLGTVYHRQEKYDLAEYHFRRALEVHPGSPVLRCHLGMAQLSNRRPYEALDTLRRCDEDDAVSGDAGRRNPQATYQRANIYMSLDRPREALAELEKVRDAAPRESGVHFFMGRVCKRLGWPERAMRCYVTALELDPKDGNLIKAAMDRLHEADVEEDVSAF